MEQRYRAESRTTVLLNTGTNSRSKSFAVLSFYVSAFVFAVRKRSLTIRVRDQTGEETYFKVRSTTAMSSVIRTYCKRKGVSMAAMMFLLDGHRVGYDETPASLELEDEDQIDAILIQSGGKPVILLYPSVPLDTTVTLELSPLWRFSALYPKPPSSKLQQASTSEV